MKKLIFYHLFLILLLTLFITACGDDSDNKESCVNNSEISYEEDFKWASCAAMVYCDREPATVERMENCYYQDSFIEYNWYRTEVNDCTKCLEFIDCDDYNYNRSQACPDCTKMCRPD